MKKALRAPEGVFRATFEDRILMSDLVFVRTWYPVAVPQYYNPVTSLLLRDKTTWTGMRTVGQIRHEMGKRPPVKANSLYRPIDGGTALQSSKGPYSSTKTVTIQIKAQTEREAEREEEPCF